MRRRLEQEYMSRSKPLQNKDPYYLKDHYDNVLLVRDNILNKDVEIFIKGGALYCDHDETKDFGCEHLDFVYSLDEVEKLKRSGRLRK